MREVLATEMLEALGVETSKTFSLIETGEELERGDEPSPTRSAVLVRLSHGHIRIGTFQRLAFFERDREYRASSSTTACDISYGERRRRRRGRAAPARPGRRRATARLAASYIAAGFVHGVLNSDNIAITGESFDYGPWRFTPVWDADFTAAYFDHHGLYAFGRQPEAIHWDLAPARRLACALIAEAEPLIAALERLARAVPAGAGRRRSSRGSASPPRRATTDRALVAALETALRRATVDDRPLLLRLARRRAIRGADALSGDEPFRALAASCSRAATPSGALDHPYWSDDAPCSMHIDEVEAIWARDRRARRLGAVRRQDRRDPADGRGDARPTLRA